MSKPTPGDIFSPPCGCTFIWSGGQWEAAITCPSHVGDPNGGNLRHRVPHMTSQAHHGYALHDHTEQAGHEGVPRQDAAPLTPAGHAAEAARLLSCLAGQPRTTGETILLALTHAVTALAASESPEGVNASPRLKPGDF